MWSVSFLGNKSKIQKGCRLYLMIGLLKTHLDMISNSMCFSFTKLREAIFSILFNKLNTVLYELTFVLCCKISGVWCQKKLFLSTFYRYLSHSLAAEKCCSWSYHENVFPGSYPFHTISLWRWSCCFCYFFFPFDIAGSTWTQLSVGCYK